MGGNADKATTFDDWRQTTVSRPGQEDMVYTDNYPSVDRSSTENSFQENTGKEKLQSD